MAKRKRKVELTQEERDEREAQRMAAHETTDVEVQSEVAVMEAPITELGVEASEEAIEAREESVDGVQDGEVAGEGDVEDGSRVTTVVLAKYKDRYIEEAKARGDANKASKRSNWDWLAQRIAETCLDDKHKINMNSFIELLDLNEVDHSKWTNRNRGWEGRFRMTGRVVLQKVVANRGTLVTPNGELQAPQDFIEKYKTKA